MPVKSMRTVFGGCRSPNLQMVKEKAKKQQVNPVLIQPATRCMPFEEATSLIENKEET